ncbi:metal-sensing transcriptional repressor [Sulfurospirillum halorespirans]|uniref:Putative NreA-like transcriptional regulator n=1 Tax=Sulfurospirillum halorespirans DSM 13726 TaxID=1193502 RepID=A0A1D7TNR4_9BACT|nr:metal-sensing transcriptional repressor [Sulfurospirillum halorespirans]AOO66564.1 putative NreA-like transcriptional regulator [Sulfurospirillum halorespirans DSM 13726]
MSQHLSHEDILKRLKRADGHLKSIMTMIENERNCAEIAQQLHAVEKAIANAKKLLIHDHIDHCLDSAAKDGTLSSDDVIKEFKQITKYL